VRQRHQTRLAGEFAPSRHPCLRGTGGEGQSRV